MTRYFNVKTVYFNGFTNDTVRNVINSIDCNNVSFVNNSAANFFANTVNATSITNISNCVVNASNMFIDCRKLSTFTNLPNTVIDVSSAYTNCVALTETPKIPHDVTSIVGMFNNCTNITTPPTIPNTVTGMQAAFISCHNLQSAPVIPNSVTNMSWTFQGCESITNVPTLPNNLKDMQAAFSKCNNITTIPTIPANTESIRASFRNCKNLTGIINVASRAITNVNSCFTDTALRKKVYVHKYDKDTNCTKVGTSVYIDDGKVTGFNESSYIVINDVIENGTIFKMLFKVKTPSWYTTPQPIFYRNDNSPYGLYLNQNRQLVFFDTEERVITTTALSLNCWYWCGITFNATTKETTIGFYSDNKEAFTIDELPEMKNWTFTKTWIANDDVFSNKVFRLGKDQSDSNYYMGTINLDDCIIYVDNEILWKGAELKDTDSSTYTQFNTEYPLYLNGTVTGTITDNDGIISGLTPYDCVDLNEKFTPNEGDDWEVCIQFTTGSDLTTTQRMLCNRDTGWAGNIAFGISQGALQYYFSANASNWTFYDQRVTAYTITENTSYFYKMTCKYDPERLIYIYMVSIKSNDDFDFVTIKSYESANYIIHTINPLRIGAGSANGFAGSIDMNQCYIKLNGKYWWKGRKRDCGVELADLDTPATIYVPEFKYMNENKTVILTRYIDDNITVRVPNIEKD